MARFAALFLCLIFATGCDTNARLDRLEKQTADLKTQVEKDQAARDFDLQAKCAKDSREWFNENWQRDKDTTLLDYSNHYDKALNACFLHVEYHYNVDTGVKTESEWVNDITVWNVYENDQIADFTQRHTWDFSGHESKTTDQIESCAVDEKKCSTFDQFSAMVRPYFSN